MQTYEKFHFESVSEELNLPLPQYSTLECHCSRCGYMYKVPIPVTYMDWEEVAGMYVSAYKAMNKNYITLLEEAAHVFDVPLKEWFEAKNEHIRMRMEALLAEMQRKTEKDYRGD